MRKIQFGEHIKDGVIKPVEALYEETKDGYTLKGVEPFSGKPISFIPMPEGYRGRLQIYRTRSLAQIVTAEENVVYKMGSNYNVYYEYKNGWCLGHYEIEKDEDK